MARLFGRGGRRDGHARWVASRERPGGARGPNRSAAEAVELVVDPEPALVGAVRAFAGSLAGELGLGRARADDLKIAISEALTNAIKAHRALGVHAPIKVVARKADDGDVVIEIVDAGGGFDAGSVRRTPVRDSDLRPGGVGILIVESLFPDAQIERNPHGGTTVRFSLGSGDSATLRG